MRKKTIISIFLVICILFSTTAYSSKIKTKQSEDFDPLVDTEVTVEIKQIRFLEEEGINPPEKSVSIPLFERLSLLFQNLFGKRDEIRFAKTEIMPDINVEVFINGIKFTSDTWSNQKYIYDISWDATLNVPDDQEFVDIKIKLWDKSSNELFDISGDPENSEDGYDAELKYSIKTGKWTGDDQISDPSGYGRLCGCDDGTIKTKDKDSELWFNIYQNDYDDDGIPYWTEVNILGTDPTLDNSEEDPDEDGIPTFWEWKWGYDPCTWDDHVNLDPDGDSINNYEEYLTSEWFSDPFRKDVFVEMDIMDEGPNGEISYFPHGAKELITTAFDRQNIVFHLDYNTMGGTDIIPFQDNVDRTDLNYFYVTYFLNNDEDNWRRGVFHYGVVVYTSVSAAGFMYRPNAFQISSSGHNSIVEKEGIDEEIVYGSAYMHELGHTFNFWPIPGHRRGQGPLALLINSQYKSCMNYIWMYKFVDYSDGTNGGVDLDDWERIDYSSFERDW